MQLTRFKTTDPSYGPVIWKRVCLMGQFCTNRTGFKGSPDPSHYIFEINAGKGRIRHTTTLKLNDEFLNRLKIDCHSNSESFYVGPDSFRQ